MYPIVRRTATVAAAILMLISPGRKGRGYGDDNTATITIMATIRYGPSNRSSATFFNREFSPPSGEYAKTIRHAYELQANIVRLMRGPTRTGEPRTSTVRFSTSFFIWTMIANKPNAKSPLNSSRLIASDCPFFPRANIAMAFLRLWDLSQPPHCVC